MEMQDKEEIPPFELRSRGGIETSLRKLLRGLSICQDGGRCAAEGFHEEEEEKHDSVILESVKPQTAAAAALDSSEASNHSRTTACSASSGSEEYQEPASYPEVNTADRTCKENNDDKEGDPGEDMGESDTPTRRDRGVTFEENPITTTEKSDNQQQPEIEEQHTLPVEKKRSSGWIGMILLALLGVLVAAVCATQYPAGLPTPGGPNLNLVGGLSRRFHEAFEEHLVKFAYSQLNINEIVQDLAASLDDEGGEEEEESKETDHEGGEEESNETDTGTHAGETLVKAEADAGAIADETEAVEELDSSLQCELQRGWGIDSVIQAEENGEHDKLHTDADEL